MEARASNGFIKSKTVRNTKMNTGPEVPRDDQKVQSIDNAQLFNNNTIENQLAYLYPESSGEFAWDPETSSKEITFSYDYRHAFLYETNYYFRTITSNRPFFSGIHYWEVIADARTEHELKIGVTSQ